MFSSSENEKKKSFFKMGNCYINGVNLSRFKVSLNISIEIYSAMDGFNKARTII